MPATYPSAPFVQRHCAGLFVRQRQGDAAGGTVVFLHGLGESGLCFEALLADRRLEGRHLLAPDLPGYGKSPWLDHPADFAATVATLEGWLDALDLRSVTLIGHSMGGVLGADLARRNPGRIAALINVEGNISIDDCTLSADADAYDPEAFFSAGFDDLLAGVAEGGRTDAALRGYATSLRLCDPRQLHRDCVELVARSRSNRLASETAEAGCPTLYLLGDPRGAGSDSRAQLDRAGVSWRAITDAGHWPYIDQPAAFLDQMIAFVDAHGGSTR